MKYKRLKDLREDNDYTQEYIAEKLKINRVVYNRYENGIRDIPTELVLELAKIYKVDTDYILGKSNIKSYNRFLNEIDEIEEILKCNKCKEKNMYHCDPESYTFLCGSCGNLMTVESKNYSEN